MCRENSSFIKIWKDNVYYIWKQSKYLLYLAQFFLKWEMIREKKVVEKSKTYFMISNFFRKSCLIWDNVEKYGRAEQATDDNRIRRMPYACCITKATDTVSAYAILIAFPQ